MENRETIMSMNEAKENGVIISFKQITFDFMVNYINNMDCDEETLKQRKAEFKSVALDENGKYNHIKTVRYFCGKYMPDLLPKKKEKTTKSEILKDW